VHLGNRVIGTEWAVRSCEFPFHDRRSTLWGWPGQNPLKWSDPSGRNPVAAAAAVMAGNVLMGAGAGMAFGALGYTLFTPSDQQTSAGLHHATAQGGIIGAAFGLNPALGLLATGGLGVASDKDAWMLVVPFGKKAPEKMEVGGGCSARAPVGRSGKGLKFPGPPRYPAETIGGRQYTGHAIDRMQERGLTPSIIEGAIENGVASSSRDGATVFTTDELKVVVGSEGQVITVFEQ
jgi:Domain of unknown function (DUF4258)